MKALLREVGRVCVQVVLIGAVFSVLFIVLSFLAYGRVKW